MIRIRIDSADSHVGIRMWTDGAFNGTLTFLPAEWFEFDHALQRAFGVRYVLENTTLLEPLLGHRLKGSERDGR